MMKKFKILILSLISTCLVLLVALGCSSLISGTTVIDFHIDGGDISVSGDVYYFQVDLTDEDVWKDHRDQIKNIDNVGFELWLTDTVQIDSSYTLTGELYIAPLETDIYTTIEEVEDNTTLIVQNLEVPSGTTTYIDWNASLEHLTNIDSLKYYAEQGTFTVFGITREAPFKIQVDSATVIVTVTFSTL
nr:hypothetical protein [candidate division Zixibacteria bacterium]